MAERNAETWEELVAQANQQLEGLPPDQITALATTDIPQNSDGETDYPMLAAAIQRTGEQEA